MTRIGTALLASFAATSYALTPPSGSHAVRVVTLTGRSAPSTAATFGGLVSAVLNDQGQAAFEALLQPGPGVDELNDRGLWAEAGSGLRLVAREGAGAPGYHVDARFNELGQPHIDAAGQVAFRASVTGDGVNITNDSGIWAEQGGALQLIAQEGSQPPGTPAGTAFGHFHPFSFMRVNTAGSIAIRAPLVHGGGGVTLNNDHGIWIERGGSLELAVRAGNAAPGAPSGAVFAGLNQPELNDAGQIAFRAELLAGPGGIDFSNSAGIWSDAGGALHAVARGSDQAPGASAGVNFSGFFPPALNNQGQTAFIGFLTSGGVTSANNVGLWSEGSGALNLVARRGHQAPGAPASAVFEDLATPVIDDLGQTAFYAALRTGSGGVTSANDEGIWSQSGGALQLLAREGSLAPGAPPGATFSTFFNNVVVNSPGQLAFAAQLSSDLGSSLWATDRTGQLRLIARPGDLFDVDEGPSVDLRTVSTLFMHGSTSGVAGHPTPLNDLGQLTFLAAFTDGTEALLVSSLVAIPEPASWVLAAMALLAPIARRGPGLAFGRTLPGSQNSDQSCALNMDSQ
jgi:hypothetical protein